jgi:transcriptional regulator with XRE-family HTH domain
MQPPTSTQQESDRMAMKLRVGMPNKLHSKQTDDVDRYIGARIRLWRRTLKIDTKLLCEKLNITYQQLQKYEKGINRISASSLYRIAQEMHIPVHYFYQENEIISQTGETTLKDILNRRMTVVEFMATKVAMRLCDHFNSISSPYVKDTLLSLTAAIADRKLTRTAADE